MDELQDRLVRLALGVLDEHGFALAGGYALQAHGLVDRMSEDVDLFTDRWDGTEFGQAVDVVVGAYRQAGLDVTVVQQAGTFARLQVVDPDSKRAGSVDLAADRRSRNPARLSIGPVLAETDAVATKVATVFSRGEARDYLDLAGILASGRYSRDQLMGMAAEVDPGFAPRLFAEALAGVDRFPDEEFASYGVDTEHITAVRETMRSWSAALVQELRRTSPGGDGPRTSPAARALRVATSRAVRAPTQRRWSEPHPGPDSGYQPPTPEGPSVGL
ncbi:MAG: nucleotidyl transferase AbiEii/AbiGii toxin family protein [Acidimicrobiaceae bacterium]|nr:nucleotidyl transferase AbiEii/AbiGii toxin family protein [Acidimicrobiaceae bacterium]